MIEPIKPKQSLTTLFSEGTISQQQISKQMIQSSVVERKDQVSSATEEVPREEVEKTLEKINRLMGFVDKRFKFDIHKKSGQVLLEIIDQNSGKVINEIPSKRLLDLMGSFRELAGLLVDKRL